MIRVDSPVAVAIDELRQEAGIHLYVYSCGKCQSGAVMHNDKGERVAHIEPVNARRGEFGFAITNGCPLGMVPSAITHVRGDELRETVRRAVRTAFVGFGR